MAMFRLSAGVVAGSSGQSAIAALAYRMAAQYTAEHTTKTPDYTAKSDELKYADIMLPDDAPDWAREAFGDIALARAYETVLAEAEAAGQVLSDEEATMQAVVRVAEVLGNSVESAERRLNRRALSAQYLRKVDLALPRELPLADQKALLRSFAKDAFTDRGMVVTISVHDKGDGNPHAHLLLSMRDLGEHDWGAKNRAWNSRALLRQWRLEWGQHVNLALERAGSNARVDHRSLRDQGLQLEPENYHPYIAEHAERVGATPVQKLHCQDVRKQNQAYIRSNPEHILAVVQARQGTFTEADVRAALMKQLRPDPAEGPKLQSAEQYEQARFELEVEVLELLADAMRSPDLLEVHGQDIKEEAQFVTRSRSQQVWQLTQDARTLAAGRLTVAEDLAAQDPIETGTGPILIDTAPIELERAAEEAAAAKRSAPKGAPRSARSGPSAAIVREALLDRAEDLFVKVHGGPVRPGAAKWNPKSQASFEMQMKGPRRGLWFDHKIGEGGDLLDLVAMEICGLSAAKADFPRVLEAAARYAGLSTEAEIDTGMLEARQAQRAREAEAAKADIKAARDSLVQSLVEVAAPASGSPGAAYLASRSITDMPEAQLAYLPPVPELEVVAARHAALVVWATDGNGRIMGGQRILVQEDGTHVDMEIRKPSFGTVSGHPARFPARIPGGPLVVAESPEAALSIWQATGHETWAVFGVSGFANVPLPDHRDVIFAPDRDAPDSPAGLAFRKAVAQHVADGTRLSIAVAPEPSGSKGDLNDTHQRAGAAVVRAAIVAARPVQRFLSPALNPGQRSAAEAILGPDQLTLVKGHAGTGKTFTIGEAARVWQARGVRVLAGAPSGKATQELNALDGIEARTLSSWEAQWARGQYPKAGRFVFIMDEAGMVGLNQWSRIQSQVVAMGGKLVAVGDPEQLRPVLDLSGWALAEAQASDVPAIDLVIRQKDAGDRAATAALAQGRIAEGISHYVDRGALRLETVAGDPVAVLASEYWSQDPGGRGRPSRIALAYSNADVEALNAAIRKSGQEAGAVARSGRRFTISRMDRRHDEDGLEMAERRAVEIQLSAGDRLMLTGPHRDLDLARSSFGTVTSVRDGAFSILMDDAREAVEINAERFNQFDYGYAATIHKSQGMSVDRVLLLPHRRMDRHSTYVALSRHRDALTVFGRKNHLDDADALVAMAKRLPAPLQVPTSFAAPTLVQPPAAEIVNRPDWSGPRGTRTPGKFVGDRHLMAVATRVAGLLRADYAETDPILDAQAAVDPNRDYTGAPQAVIPDLLARQTVFRADDVAAVLAKPIRDPDTFLRLFRQAMAHEDLVALPGSKKDKEADPWVYTTRRHLAAELAALDRGVKLSQSPIDVAAEMPFGGLSEDQRAALEYALAPGAIRLVQGAAGSGKTRLAAMTARAHEAAGSVVTVISPTEAGRRALAEEGVGALTFAEFLAEPMAYRGPDAPGAVVVLDDANGLGIGRADVLLARIEAMSAKLIAFQNPQRRPLDPGPVFRSLADRIGTAELSGLEGVSGPVRDLLTAIRQPEAHGSGAIEAARAAGLVQASGGQGRAMADLARAYVADPTDDKIVLAWSRRAADELTTAIRAELDRTRPERATAEEIPDGPLAGLKPGDRIRFATSGVYGSPERDPAREQVVQRGAQAEVMARDPDGLLRLRVAEMNAHGRAVGSREIRVAPEGPLPPWHYSFASSIAASAGRRHDSVHLLAAVGMDREGLATGVATSRSALNLAVPATDREASAFLDRIVARERAPRAAADYGFDPGRAQVAAMHAPDLPIPGTPSAPELPPQGLDPEDVARLTRMPKIPLSAAHARAANTAYLQNHPDHIVALLQSDRAVFTEHDVRQALRARLGRRVTEPELRRLGDRAMASGALVPLDQAAPDGSPQYVTVARLDQIQRSAEQTRMLAKGRFAPGEAPVLRPEELEGLNPMQRQAAEAMLNADRLTLVQGHAGTGKTHTLRDVARIWQERGVAVLAGAPSGKATRELAGLEGVTTATLAAWEARWARGEAPDPGRFVFLMDEAGMVGAGQWGRLQAQILAMGGKLIAIGDPDQLQPVADLPGWNVAERAVGSARTVLIDTVVRQKEVLQREATEMLVRGGAGVRIAIDFYDSIGALRLRPEDRADPFAALAGAFFETSDPTRSRVAIAYTNRDVHRLNDLIRAEALARGIVDRNSQRSYGSILRRTTAPGGRTGQERVPLRLGVGDRIMLTKPHRDLNLPRSSFGTVLATRAAEIDILFDQTADPVTLDLQSFRDIDYGFASTIHKSQGLTAQDVFVLPHRLMHRHATYVALSRHSDNLHVFGRAGHFERVSDLVAMAQAPGHLSVELPDGPADPGASMVPTVTDAQIALREDWRGAERSRRPVALAGDAELMGIAERTAGLLAADWQPGAPVLREDGARYAARPTEVIDDVIRRRSVLRAEDVAARLAHVIADPDTFLRAFREAMSHPDLILLSDDPATTGRSRVYTTRTQLRGELDAVDRGIRLALSPSPDEVPDVSKTIAARLGGLGLSEAQANAVSYTGRGGRLRLIRGDAGSGKTRVATATAELHREAGWSVMAVSPSGAGLDALRAAGVERPRTLRGFSAGLASGQVRLDPGTVVILDDAGRLGSQEIAPLLRAVEKAGAKLVALMDDGVQTPLEAGPVVRALAARIGVAELDDSFRWDQRRALAMGGLVGGGTVAQVALNILQEDGVLHAGGTARKATALLAKRFVEDPTQDKVALAWSRAEVGQLTDAIRTALDIRDPERTGFEGTEEGSFAGLKPGDRVQFMGGGRVEDRTALRGAQRVYIRPGSRAEYIGTDPRGRQMLRLTGSDETSRAVRLAPDTNMPDWRFDFANTIHGAIGQARDSVHLLASPGMSKQMLTSGARLHREELSIVVPASETRMPEVLSRILQRDATAESALDYGFEPALAARQAMQGQAREVVADAAPDGIASAMGRLREIAGLGHDPSREVAPRGFEGEVLAEVIVAATLRHGKAPDGADLLALEGHVQALTDAGGWRKILRQAPKDLPQRADRLAIKLAGHDEEGRALTTARILARGHLSAEALGESGIAHLFADGLALYGQRAEDARASGQAQELVAPSVLTRDLPTYPEIQPPRETRRVQSRLPLPYAPRGGGLEAFLSNLNPSNDKLTRDALDMFGLDGQRRRARARSYAAARQSMRDGSAYREAKLKVKAQELLRRADRIETSGKPVATAERPVPQPLGAALQMALAITEHLPSDHPAHERDLLDELHVLLGRAEAVKLPEDQVRATARKIAVARAGYDAKLELGRSLIAREQADYDANKDTNLEWQGMRRPTFKEQLFRRYANHVGSRIEHPMAAQHQRVKAAYDDEVKGAVAKGVDRYGAPTTLEWVAARIAHMPGVPHDLADGLTRAMGTGSPQRAQEIEQARSDVLDQLSNVDDQKGDARDVLPQLYKAFTYKEIEALAKPIANAPASLTHVPKEQRQAISQRLTKLTEGELFGVMGYAWGDHAERMAKQLHPQRGQSRGSGRGLF